MTQHQKESVVYLREAQLTYRRRNDGALRRTPLRSSRDVYAVLRPLLEDRICESVVVLAVCARHLPIGFHEVARGGVSECAVRAADVFRYPLVAGAHAFILAHNHPSGNSEPSPEDIAFTRRLQRASDLLGVKFLDHLVIGEDSYTSFLDVGLMSQ